MGSYLITGASSGIGKACAERLSQEGHTVVLVARNREKLEAVKASLPSPAFCFPYDLSRTDGVKEIFDFCKEQTIKLDGLVYAAGLNADVPMKVASAELMEQVMRVNCISFAQMAKYFFSKRYANDFARIVTISSISSLTCEKGMGPYNASKAALNALVKTLSKEFVRRGILVNAVLPAGVITPLAAEKIEKLTGTHVDVEACIREIETAPYAIQEGETQPYGLITPACIAELAAYLVSPKNRYLTGTLIPVTAGLAY